MQYYYNYVIKYYIILFNIIIYFIYAKQTLTCSWKLFNIYNIDYKEKRKSQFEHESECKNK